MSGTTFSGERERGGRGNKPEPQGDLNKEEIALGKFEQRKVCDERHKETLDALCTP